jgi:outer membrane lipoprotein-sorting protein
VAVLLILTALALPACSSAKTTALVSTANTTIATTLQSITTTVDITALFSKASTISSMKYDMITTIVATQTTTNVWLKANKMKMQYTQGTTTVINIIDTSAKTIITYLVGQTFAYPSTYTPQESPTSSLSSFAAHSPSVLGAEMVGGYACTIIQYVSQRVTTKAWIWNDRGVIVKMQSATSQGSTTTIEFKNIDFGAIDDSIFQVPAGVILMTEPEMG